MSSTSSSSTSNYPTNPIANALSMLRFRLDREIALAVMRLLPSLRNKLVGPPVYREGTGFVLDPQVQLALLVARRLGVKPMHTLTLAQARAELDRSANGIAPRHVPLETLELRVAGCAARLYRPAALKGVHSAPALVFFHGGGYVVGSTEGYDRTLRAFATLGNFVVISVDYRLSPEHKYPAAIHDASAAYLEVRKRAMTWGIDPERIAVGGDSAGGTLSAVTCLEHRRHNLPLPKAQLLIYPATDLGELSPSRQELPVGYFLEERSIQWFLEHYLDDLPMQLPEVRVSPLKASPVMLQGLPPAIVLIAGFDPLCDEGLAYAQALRDAGVRTVVRTDEGMFHGYWTTAGAITKGRKALEWTARELARELQTDESVSTQVT